MIFTHIRAYDDILISGIDGAGLWHDELFGTVSTVTRDGSAIKVWPHDEKAGNGSGKIWFEWFNMRQLVVFPDKSGD